MLQIAVTGGIGSGKSTVSARLGELGALVIDSDRLAREVVAPGTAGLAAVVNRFGPAVLTDGALNRAALAAVVFSDPAALRDLEAITHPRVRERFAELAASAPDATVVVNDIPILVDPAAAAAFHLVVGVGADIAVRVARLVERGLSAADAHARIANQIGDDQRLRLTDAWLTNDQDRAALQGQVDALWRHRIQPFHDNLRAGRAAGLHDGNAPSPGSVTRVCARVRLAVDAGAKVGAAGSAVEVSVGVGGLPDLARGLAAAGFFPLTADAGCSGSGRFGSADPGCTVRVVASEVASR